MKKIMILLLLAFGCSRTPVLRTQEKPAGGPCEGCEALFEYGRRKLSATDTLPDYALRGTKLKITGQIFKPDGHSPAAGVILYIYHTSTRGLYEKRGGETGWAKRHGYIRGWVKTGADGRYTFYTLRPGAYPDRSEPEHIHATLKEPGVQAYYIDEFVFDDDPLLTQHKRSRLENRGGSGLVLPQKQTGFLLVKRDITLGRNIPGYE